MSVLSRREFLARSSLMAALPAVRAWRSPAFAGPRFGLVTYLWGRDWDLPTLLRNCESADVLAVELRTSHAHGVEPSLSEMERLEVKQRFADSPVSCLGPGSNEAFHHVDQDRLAQAIANTRRLVDLSRAVGGTGVKVKPNAFPKGVEREKTIQQIGESLRTCAAYAQDQGQEIRVEVHGRGTQQLPAIKAIMEVADHPAARVCWNSNPQDLDGEGLEHNFASVERWFGATAHVRELDVGDYPYQKLVDLFVAMDYRGWICLEARTDPSDRVAALRAQRELFDRMVARARAKRERGIDRR